MNKQMARSSLSIVVMVLLVASLGVSVAAGNPVNPSVRQGNHVDDTVYAACSNPTAMQLVQAMSTPGFYATVKDAKYEGHPSQKAVFTQNIQGFPLQGGSFTLLSTGIAADAPGTATTFASTDMGGVFKANWGPYGLDAYDLATLSVAVKVPDDASTLTFSYKFATDESPDFLGSQFKDFFRVTAYVPDKGVCPLIPLLPDGSLIVHIDNAAKYSNVPGGTCYDPLPPLPEPDDTVYNAVTSLQTVQLDVSGFRGMEMILTIEIADASDPVYDSAVFIDSFSWDATLPLTGKVIVIDPGHGIKADGRDDGAPGHYAHLPGETHLVLQISQKLRQLLEGAGATVIMTREDDDYVSLAERVTIANTANANIFVSVHLNSVASQAPEGTVTLYYGRAGQYEDAQGRYLAEAIQAPLSQKLETSDKLWTRVWRDHDLRGFHLSVLANTNMPAVITESVFISNPSEHAMIAQEDWQWKAAEGHYQGISEFFRQYPSGVVTETLSVSVASPVSLRVYDSANRVTGLVDGEVKAEIPGSSYSSDTSEVTIIPPTDTYRIEVHGHAEGTYTLSAVLYDGAGMAAIEVKDLVTSTGEIHLFQMDWQALANGMKGITITIDDKIINTSTPNIASSPTPADQATDVRLDTALSWQGGDDADPEKQIYYEISFGTELIDLPLELTEVIGPFPGDQSSINYQLQSNLGQLDYNTTYYWQIVAKDGYGVASYGPAWQFTTSDQIRQPPPTVGTAYPMWSVFVAAIVAGALLLVLSRRRRGQESA